MPPKIPGTSYSGKPVRRLKLPKIGPAKTQSLFEEYFYTLLAVVFFTVAILGKAGGFSGINALIVAAWVTAFLWFAKQLKAYFAEASKTENEKTPASPPAAPAEAPKGPLPLPPGMKPMIGPQWPVKRGSRPAWPRLPKQKPATLAQTGPAQAPGSQMPTVQTSTIPAPPTQAAATPGNSKRQGFVYERPTLPDRRPQLPNNWPKPDKKKPKK